MVFFIEVRGLQLAPFAKKRLVKGGVESSILRCLGNIVSHVIHLTDYFDYQSLRTNSTSSRKSFSASLNVLGRKVGSLF